MAAVGVRGYSKIGIGVPSFLSAKKDGLAVASVPYSLFFPVERIWILPNWTGTGDDRHRVLFGLI